MEGSVKDKVLWAIADDYESLDMIFGSLKRWARERGRVITREEIMRALEQLTKEGSAQAYVLSGRPPYATPVEFSATDEETLWFYVTEKGKSLVKEWVKPHPPGSGRLQE